jgi:hypothetical protein
LTQASGPPPGVRSADAAGKNPAVIAPNLTHPRCPAFICHLSVNKREDLSGTCRTPKIVAGANSERYSLSAEMQKSKGAAMRHYSKG